MSQLLQFILGLNDAALNDLAWNSGADMAFLVIALCVTGMSILLIDVSSLGVLFMWWAADILVSG